MRATILGSAAGGGYPQWNCGCENCAAVREGRPGFTARTQDSVAVTSDGERYALLNTSPDVLAQVQATRALWPCAPRHSPIAAVILTNGDLDHVLGLFCLRESWPLAVYATASVARGLEASVFIRTLRRFEGQLALRALPLGEEITVEDAAGAPLGLRVRALPAPGKLPVHLVGHAAAGADDNVALVVREGEGKETLAYAAACAEADDALVTGHAALLFDGTFFSEDELVRQGLSRSVAKDMAHVPIGGPNGSLARLGALPGRKIFTHINNTNPILAPASAERRAVLDAGWEIAVDGLEVTIP